MSGNPQECSERERERADTKAVCHSWSRCSLLTDDESTKKEKERKKERKKGKKIEKRM